MLILYEFGTIFIVLILYEFGTIFIVWILCEFCVNFVLDGQAYSFVNFVWIIRGGLPFFSKRKVNFSWIYVSDTLACSSQFLH